MVKILFQVMFFQQMFLLKFIWNFASQPLTAYETLCSLSYRCSGWDHIRSLKTPEKLFYKYHLVVTDLQLCLYQPQLREKIRDLNKTFLCHIP